VIYGHRFPTGTSLGRQTYPAFACGPDDTLHSVALAGWVLILLRRFVLRPQGHVERRARWSLKNELANATAESLRFIRGPGWSFRIGQRQDQVHRPVAVRILAHIRAESLDFDASELRAFDRVPKPPFEGFRVWTSCVGEGHT
jgi:hypothetical protein